MNSVGIDIGSSSIKVVEVGKNGREMQVLHAGITVIPSRMLLSESALDQEELARTLKKMLADCDIKTKDANISLMESQLFTRIIEMPQLSEKELQQALRWEAEQYIPLPLDEVNMDYAILEKEKNSKKMQVMIVAAPLRLLDKYVKLFKLANIYAPVFENESLSLFRLFKDPILNILIVDIGETATGLTIFNKEVFFMSRTISIGSMLFSKALSTELNIPLVQAEEYKRTYGLESAQPEGKVAQTIYPIVENILVDIQQSLSYFKEKHLDEVLSRIVLTGGGAQLPHLASYIQEKTLIETVIGNPWQNFIVEKKVADLYAKDLPSFSVATGLAIRDLV